MIMAKQDYSEDLIIGMFSETEVIGAYHRLLEYI